MNDFGERLKNLRKERGITQQALADKLNVHPQTISKWERGISQPDMCIFGEMANILGVSLERLWGVPEDGKTFSGSFEVAALGKAIVRERKTRGESQQQLADALGVTAGAVSKWERGVICPDLCNLLALSGHFNISPSELYYCSPEQVCQGASPSAPSADVSAAVLTKTPRRRAALFIIIAAFFVLLAAAFVAWLIPRPFDNVGDVASGETPPAAEQAPSPESPSGGQNNPVDNSSGDDADGAPTSDGGSGEETADDGAADGGQEEPVHVHSYSSRTVAPTCTAGGYTLFYCACGESYTSQYVSAKGHAAGGWFEYLAPTCSAEGEMRRCCTACGAVVEKLAVSKSDHEYAATTVQPQGGEQGYTLHRCNLCGSSYKDNFFSTPYSEGLEYTSSGDGVAVKGIGSGTDENIVIPSYMNGLPVTAIADNAFENCNKLKSITIPDTVASIGRSAFSGCMSLEEVELPSSLREIGEGAFSSAGITRIKIPSGVEKIQERTFADCAFLEEVTFSYGLGSIEYMAFYRCESLAEADIPQSVTAIADEAFCGCRSMARVVLPSGISKIGYSTFSDCVSLKEVTIPEGVVIIDDLAFNNCRNLASVSLPKTLKTIGGYAFNCNYSLASITISSSVKSIGDHAFASCTSLASVVFGDCSGWSADGLQIGSSCISDDRAAARLLIQEYVLCMWKKN